ncbi:MAG: vWA domain-containing protein, partial [Candidatus Thorarchaeota archaeon]
MAHQPNHNPSKLMTKLRLKLLFDYPFFANIAMKLTMIPTNTTYNNRLYTSPTIATDGEVLVYNSDYIETQTKKDQLFIMLHEIMHIICKHHTRKLKSYDHDIWNVACDFVDNEILSEIHGLTLPADALIDPDFFGMTPEYIYRELTKSQPPQSPQSNGRTPQNQQSNNDDSSQLNKQTPNTDQSNDSNPNDSNQSVSDQSGSNQPHSEELSEMIETSKKHGQVLQTAKNVKEVEQDLSASIILSKKMAGRKSYKMPAKLQKITSPSSATPWNILLSKYFHDVSKSDWDWTIPNEEFISTTDVILPSLHNQTMLEFVVAIDTSGSIDRPMLKTFISEVKKILSDIEYQRVHVICCAHELSNKPQIFEYGDPIDINDFDTGGTCFYPVFEHVEEQDINPALLIYFTDLECHDYDHFQNIQPNYPIIWCTVSNDWKK